MKDYIAIASNLFAGGWRASDYQELQASYGFEPSELETICDWLDMFEGIE